MYRSRWVPLATLLVVLSACSGEPTTYGHVRGIPESMTVYASVVVVPESLDAALGDTICPPIRDSVLAVKAEVDSLRAEKAMDLAVDDAREGMAACMADLFRRRRTGACDETVHGPEYYMNTRTVQRIGAERLERVAEDLQARLDSLYLGGLAAAPAGP